MHVCICVCGRNLCVCVRERGGQKITLGVIEIPSTTLETGCVSMTQSLPGRPAWLARAGRDFPVSTSLVLIL